MTGVFLLDTHVALWSTSDDPRLSARHLNLLVGAGPFFFSHASFWEIAIKQALGKLSVAVDFRADMEGREVAFLPIRLDHIDRVAALPHHHRDPFDRMLVAQAACEGMTILTSDPRFAAYGVEVIH